MKEIRKEIWNNGYLTLYSDGTMGISDGVGYICILNEEEVKELYLEIKNFLNTSSKYSVKYLNQL